LGICECVLISSRAARRLALRSGKRNLEKALAAAAPRSKGAEFKTVWRPFFLMPQAQWRSGEFPQDAQTKVGRLTKTPKPLCVA